MNSKVEALIKLAERFARKLSFAQVITGDDPKSITTDAFFGPSEEGNFQTFILNPDSHFSKALPETIKSVDIGAQVDAKTRSANFLISTNPPAPQLHAVLIHALQEDYKAKYGKYPGERFAERLARNDIRPPNVAQNSPAIIHIS